MSDGSKWLHMIHKSLLRGRSCVKSGWDKTRMETEEATKETTSNITFIPFLPTRETWTRPSSVGRNLTGGCICLWKQEGSPFSFFVRHDSCLSYVCRWSTGKSSCLILFVCEVRDCVWFMSMSHSYILNVCVYVCVSHTRRSHDTHVEFDSYTRTTRIE